MTDCLVPDCRPSFKDYLCKIPQGDDMFVLVRSVRCLISLRLGVFAVSNEETDGLNGNRLNF
jgi:hypothetical protein